MIPANSITKLFKFIMYGNEINISLYNAYSIEAYLLRNIRSQIHNVQII